MKIYFCSLLLLLFSVFAYSQDINLSLKNYKTDDCKISYNLISPEEIKVVALDKNNQPIENLSKKDFTLKVRNNSTEIVRVVPLSETTNAKYKVVLCLDNSASMVNYSKELLKILDTLISSFSKSAEITVTFFDNSNYPHDYKFKNEPLKVQLEKYSNQPNGLKEFCNKHYDIDYVTDRTYLRDQLYVAFNSVTNEDQKDVFYIILSDGEDNASETKKEDVLNSFKQGKIYSIDFNRSDYGIYGRENLLEELSKKSNGEYFKAKDAVELAAFFNRIAKKIIFSGYEIDFKEFYPPEIPESEVYYLENNAYKNTNKIKIEEIKSKEFYPLLNYVFFNKNSSDLIDRYVTIRKEDVFSFEEKKLLPDQLSVYRNILNIIGKRLIQNDKIKIKLIGCNDNEGEEKNNLSLSNSRAETVRNYLINIWGIPSERITIKSQNLPQKPSNIRHINGQEENRRVEIISNDPLLFDPVDIESNTKIAEPGNLQVHLNTKYSSPPDSWEIKVTQHGEGIFNLTGKGYPPPYIPWNINETIKNKNIDNSPFEIFVKLQDSKGLEYQKPIMQMPVEYLSSQQKKLEKIQDKYVEKLSLVLFDFNSSILSKQNQDILLKAKDAIFDNSKLKMIGYTDSIGTESSNTKLSQLRAANALKELVKILKPTTKELSSDGYGESIPLYDNGTPEGRFYNRTCQMIIETPIKMVEEINK
ncbi:MAG: OmpA family protein [Bacteroidetes bacterium]|nr:OmpA family protein [Bacteroidota bacterium]